MYPFSLIPDRDRKTLGDQIYVQLRENIVALQLEPGKIIYENELADMLGVSRTPVREAFRLLANEELIEVMPQRGTKVALISERKVAEARFIRETLETGAFSQVAKLWDDSMAARYEPKLLELLEQQKAAAEQQDILELLKFDEDFHKTMMMITDNQTLLQVINHMRAHINRLRFLALKESDQLGRIIDEHHDILFCIQKGDQDLTARALDQHFRKLDSETPQLRKKYPDYFID